MVCQWLLFLVMDECTRELEKNRDVEIEDAGTQRWRQRERDLPVSIRLGCKLLQVKQSSLFFQSIKYSKEKVF
jgi:hypothetical protein